MLTTASVINGDLYIGEINFGTKQNYVTVNEQTIPVENTVNMIYEMEGKPYFGSFKSELNNNIVSSYLIESDHAEKQEGSKIYFSK